MTPTELIAKSIFLERRLDSLNDQEISIFGTDENWKDDHNIWNLMSDTDKEIWINRAKIWMEDLQINSTVIYDYMIDNCLLE
jgi:hypothetical protein